MAPNWTLSQPGGAGAGVENDELLACREGVAINLTASVAASYAWTVASGAPVGESTTITTPTAQVGTWTPAALGYSRRVRLQLVTPGGSRILVAEVSKNAAGATIGKGLAIPAFAERKRESLSGFGAWSVFSRLRTALVALFVDYETRIVTLESGGAGVSSVSGTAPIASSGGATPVISLNDGGVALAKLADLTGPVAIARLAGTGVPQATPLVETPTAAVSIPLRTATGGLQATRFHLSGDDNYFGDSGEGCFIEGVFCDVNPSGDCSIIPGGDLVLNPSGSIFCGSKQLKSVADPTSAQHAATMGWVQANTTIAYKRSLIGKDLTLAASYSDLVLSAVADIPVTAATTTLIEVHVACYRKVVYSGEGGPATVREAFHGTFRAEVLRDSANEPTPLVTLEPSAGDTEWVLASASGKTIKAKALAVSGGFKIQVGHDQITIADYAGAISITSAALNIAATVNLYPVATIA